MPSTNAIRGMVIACSAGAILWLGIAALMIWLFNSDWAALGALAGLLGLFTAIGLASLRQPSTDHGIGMADDDEDIDRIAW